MIVAIDPGKHIGYALAYEGRLVACGTVKDRTLLPDAAIAWIEMPRVYPYVGKWKGDPQDVVRLAYLAGQIADQYRVHLLVSPARVPKRVRAARALACLRADDAPLGRLSNHATDALYILLVQVLGRRPAI